MIQNVNPAEQNKEKALELLKQVFSVNMGNETPLENLHEMFLCFVRADDDQRHDRDSIILTYEILRDLLIDSNKLFKVE